MRIILTLFSTIIFQLAFTGGVKGQDFDSETFVKIFIDCEFGCDHTYFRQEMNYVNFMQNRQEADVFMQLTIQRTGGDGREYQLRVQSVSERFSIATDTLIFYTYADATDNIRRNAILDQIKKGLLPILVQTPLADKIEYNIQLDDDSSAPSNEEVNDPWNYWVFRLRFNSFFNGQESARFLNLYNSISANRTTEEHKFAMSLNYSLSRSSFDLSDDETFSAKNENASMNVLYVNSLGNNWSAGFRSRLSTSTFGNIRFGARLRPAIEYNIFPYNQSSQNQFVFRYSIGPSYVDYEEVTVFDKLEEWLYEQSIDIEYEQIKDWGNVSVELEYENYLHDWSQLSISLNPQISWNLARGLIINIWGEIAYISNLRNIQKSEIDNNEILLQNRQLDTSFEYYGSLGLTYRFGSAFNNIVNPRF